MTFSYSFAAGKGIWLGEGLSRSHCKTLEGEEPRHFELPRMGEFCLFSLFEWRFEVVWEEGGCLCENWIVFLLLLYMVCYIYC